MTGSLSSRRPARSWRDADAKMAADPEGIVQRGIGAAVGARDDPEGRDRRRLPRRLAQMAGQDGSGRGGQKLAGLNRLFGRTAAEDRRCLPAPFDAQIRPCAKTSVTQDEPFAISK